MKTTEKPARRRHGDDNNMRERMAESMCYGRRDETALHLMKSPARDMKGAVTVFYGAVVPIILGAVRSSQTFATDGGGKQVPIDATPCARPYVRPALGDDSGATAVEYSLIMGLVGVMIIAGLVALGGRVGGTFAQVATVVGDPIDAGSGGTGTSGTGGTGSSGGTGGMGGTGGTGR